MNLAIVGLGSMGSKHYSVAQEIDDIKNTFLVDPKNDKAEYDSVDDLLAKQHIDLAVVATPTSMHKEAAVKLLQKGVHVLIEKPIAMDMSECSDIRRAMSSSKSKAAVGHIERFNPAIQALIADLKDKKVINCSINRLSPFPGRIQDVGVKLDLGIHDVDLVSFITGQGITKASINSSTTKAAKEDTASFLFEFHNGATANIFTTWLSPYRERTVKVLTDGCYYEADLLRHQVVKYECVDSSSYVCKPLYVRRANPLREQLQSFIKYINGENSKYLCSVPDAVNALCYVGEKIC